MRHPNKRSANAKVFRRHESKFQGLLGIYNKSYNAQLVIKIKRMVLKKGTWLTSRALLMTVVGAEVF